MSNNVIRKVLVFAVFILFLAVFSESASAAITACGSVGASDSLTQNISSADTCLLVTANNVNINCNGFSITFNTGVAAPPSFGVYANNLNNITVRNCILIDANASSTRKAGVFFDNVTVGNISNNTVTIRGRGNAAIFRIEGSNVTIQNNRANVTTEDFSTGNITNGILLHYGSGHRVLNNIINATGGGGPGLLYSNNSNSCVFNGNNVSSNASGNGIELRDTINCAVSDNAVIMNPGGTPNGISVNVLNNISSSNNVTRNRVTLNGAGATGAIVIGANASNNISFNNITVISATARGMLIASNGANFFHNNIINISNSNSSSARAFESQGLQPVGLFTDNIVLINSNLCNQLGLVYLDRVRHGTFERNNLTILCQGTSHIAGFYILNATNLTFRNNIINISTSNSNWFRVNQASFNTTFINTTFTDNNGLATFFSFVNATSSFVNRTQFNFTNSTIFVNTTNLTYLNTSAQVTLFNPVSAMSPPKLGVDFEDDGTFTPCADNICRVLSSSSTALTFNVTRFTSFSSSSFFPAVVNETSNLTSNITANGSAFIINASNIVFDCQGFTINFDSAGAGGVSAFQVSSRTNVTIKNCIIVDVNSSGANTYGFNFTTVTNSTILNNTITTNGTSGTAGVFLSTTSFNNLITNNTINAIGSTDSNRGIYSILSSSRAIITGNTIRTFGTSGNVGLRLEFANHTYIDGNTIETNGTSGSNLGIDAVIPVNVTITNNNITTNGTTSNYGIGFSSTGSTSNRIEGNRITARGTSFSNFGITLNSTTLNSTINNNIVSTNGGSFSIGILVGNIGNNVTNNIVTTNGTSDNYGIQLATSANQTIVENNTVTTDGTTANHGIRIVGVQNNTLTNNRITVYGTGDSVGVQLTSSAINNTFTNTTITSFDSYGINVSSSNNTFNIVNITAPFWIMSDSGSQTNFTATTFNTGNGSITFPSTISFNGNLNITNSNLNVSYNRSFVNSTNLSFLNTTAQITLHNISVNATAVDFNDDGVYEACNATQCQTQSFNGSTIVFNVSSFTSYSAMNITSSSPPEAFNVTLIATSAQNTTNDNLTVYFNVTDADGNATTNTTDWRINSTSMAVLNMPFEAGTSNSSFTDDFSTYENNGNVTGATFNSSGGYNGFGAYQFDGNDYISVADSVSLQFPYSQFTLSAWVNPSSLPAIAGIIGKDDGAGSDVYQLRLDSGVLTGFVRDGASAFSMPTGATLNTNQWTFVALVQNSTAVQLYVNGTVSGSAVSISGTGNISPTNTLFIGDLLSPSSFPFSGVIDDVRIYNRSLSPQQLLAIYNNRTDLIVSQETQTGEVWQSCVTPNDRAQNGSTVCSNNLTISTATAACPGTISISTTLTENVTSAGNCVTFGASNIELNCNGYTMTWDTGGTGTVGVRSSGRSNITVRNCVMNDGNSGGTDGYGISFSGTPNSFIINNTIYTNGTDNNYGIRLANSSNGNFIANNTIRSNGSGDGNTAIFVDTSNNSLIFNNTLLPYGGGSNPHGIEFSNANDNNITQNNITKLTNVGNAIRFGNTCQRNIINGNYIDMTSDGQNTIEMNNNYQNTTIINNYIADGGFRGVLSNANGENLNVTNNTIFLRQNTVVVGILINTQGSVANDNKIYINTSNNAYGIRSTGVSSGTIQNNYISFNTTASGYGISLEDTTNSIISGNNVSINSTTTDNRGIRTQGTTTDNNITNNNLNVNGTGTNYGIIFTANTHNNFVENNNILVQTGSQNEGIHSNTGSSNRFFNNNITVFGSLNNRGIRFFNNANNNTASNNIINVNGTTSYGVFVDGTLNIFNNNTLNNTEEWIQTSTGAQGNFTNTTFQTQNGSIFISGLVQLNDVKLVTRNVLNISLNSAYVNSTNMSALNQSAQILLRNIPPSNPQPIVDFEDDGTFVDCNATQCTVINSSNITFIMNVSSFTNYSTEDSISCGSTLTSSTTLTENLTCPGTAFIIGANNVALDCNGNYIAYGGNGSNNQVAINASGVSGVSIRNCVIHDYNSSGSDGYGIWFTHVNNSVISNNIITTNGTTTNYGIRINGSTTNVNNTVTNNTINAVGSSNNNIGIYAGRIHILNISQNNISTSGSTGNDGISLQITVTNATVNDNVVSAGGITSAVVGIFTSSVVNSTFHRNRVQTIGSGARFTDSSDLSIENNSINGSVGGGVNIENAGRTSLIGNNISSSSGSGLTYTGLFGSGNHLADSNRINGTEGVNYGSTQPNSNLTNNNITATNGHGIVINSNSPTIYLNNNILTMSPPSGGPFYGVDVGATNNSIVNNLNLTILGNTAWMRTTVAGRTTNFTNTTLRNNNGSVFYLGTFQLENQSAVELTSLNISTNRVRLNSSTVPFLNRSAQIILNNVNTSIPIVDFEDDGTYRLCNATQCQLQSFNGSTIVFNVSSFTSYSTSSGGVNVTLTKTDNPNPVPNGSYLNYTITFNVTGGTAYNITINETYPNNVTFVNATPNPTTGNNSWNAGNLTASQFYQINITVLVAGNLTGGTILTNTVNATYENSSGTQFLINVSENTTVSVPLDPPVLANVTLFATSIQNTTDDNLTVAFNLTSPGTMNPAWNITDWRMNASSIVFFQYPFEINVSDITTSLKDYSTSNISATLGFGSSSATPNWTTSGQVGAAYDFDGTDDQINISDTRNPTEYSIEVWVKPDANTSRNIFVRTAGNPLTTWSHQLRISSGSVFQHMAFDGATILVTGTTGVVPGNWYHVVGTAENGGNLSLYVNGVQEGSNASLGTLWTGGNQYRVGSNSGDAMSFFDGIIDEVRLYNRSLTSSEIALLYNEGLANRQPTKLHSSETEVGEVWSVAVTPNNHDYEGNTTSTNNLTIRPAAAVCPGTITTDTNLTGDINAMTTGSCVLFGANNIVLDCQGYTMTGNGSGLGVNATSRSGITVRNCNIVNFSNNILWTGVTSSSINNVNASNSTGAVISLASSSNNNQLSNIFVQGITNSDQFETTTASNNTYTNIRVITNGTGNDFEFAGVTDSRVNNLTVTGNASSGNMLQIASTSTGNNFSNIFINSASKTAINVIAGTNNNHFRNVTIENSTTAGNTWNFQTGTGSINNLSITGTTGNGISISGGVQVNVSNAYINKTVSGIGISASNFGVGTVLENITAASGSGDAINLALNGMILRNITGISSSGNGLQIDEDSNIVSNSYFESSSSDAISIGSLSANGTMTTVTAISSSGQGIAFSGDNYSMNNITSRSGSNFGMTFSSGAMFNVINDSRFSSNTSGALQVGNQNTTFNNNILETNRTWIQFNAGISNVTFSRTTFLSANGSINFTSFTAPNSSSVVNQTRLNASLNRAFLNSTNLTFLNVSAQITLTNVNSSVLLVDFEDDGTFTLCSPPQCVLQSFSSGTVVFNVSSFTSYSTSNFGGVNVTLSKSDSPDPINLTNTTILTYQINFTVTNGTAFNVTINETYPNNTTFINSSPTASSGNDGWNVGNLTAGQTYQINITINVSSSLANGTSLINTISATYENSTGNQFNLSVSEATTVINEVVVQTNATLTKTDSPDPLNISNSTLLTYQINFTVTNGTAYNIVINDTYPGNATFVNATPSPTTGNNSWSAGNISATNTYQINITVNVSNSLANGTIITNTVNTTYNNATGSTLTTNVQENTTIIRNLEFNATAITLTKTDAPDPVVAGQNLVYTININVTNGTAHNITLTDSYPPQVSFVSASPAANSSNNTWVVGNLTIGQSFQVNITVNVNSSTANGTTINNTANISYANSTGSVLTLNATTQTLVSTQSFPIVINNNTNITTNGSTTGPGIIINSSNVTVNCNNNIITGSGSSVGINTTGFNNVTLLNCVFVNFATGAYFENSNNDNFINNTFRTVTNGINLLGTSQNSAFNNTVIAASSDWVFTSAASSGNVFQNTSYNDTGGQIIITPAVTYAANTNASQSRLDITSPEAFLNSSALSFLDVASRVTINGINNTATALILGDFDDDGTYEICSAPSCTLISFASGTAIFDASGWTSYTVVDGGVNFTLTKTSSPDPVTPGNNVVFTITATVNSGFAQNITVVESPPAELTFVTSTPTNISANTWLLNNLSAGQSAQINVTYSVNSSFTGTIVNNVSVTFQNSTNGTISTNVSQNTTAQTPSPSGGGGGGGGGGSSASICPPFCQYPENKDLPVCRNNCPPAQAPAQQDFGSMFPPVSDVVPPRIEETVEEPVIEEEAVVEETPVEEPKPVKSKFFPWWYILIAIIAIVFMIWETHNIVSKIHKPSKEQSKLDKIDKDIIRMKKMLKKK